MTIDAMTLIPRDLMKRSSGFTLLEIVIAIAILAVVLSSLYGAYISSVEATERVENARGVEQAARLALLQMADDFKSLYYEEVKGDLEASPYRLVSGDMEAGEDARTIVEFASTSHLGFDVTFPNPSVNRVLYLLEEQPEEGQQHRLVRRERPAAQLSGGVEETSLVLVEGVEELALEYLDAEGQVASEWDSSTSETGDSLPRLVRIRLQIATSKSGDSRLYTMSAALPVWEEEPQSEQ